MSARAVPYACVTFDHAMIFPISGVLHLFWYTQADVGYSFGCVCVLFVVPVPKLHNTYMTNVD
jgi:hypothetical protein